jgi:stage V sporulation protein SpoVS
MANTVELKVSKEHDVLKLAATISYAVKSMKNVELLTVGKDSINQAVKAVSTANEALLTYDGIEISIIPTFKKVMVDDEERVSICLSLHPVKNCSDYRKSSNLG